MNRERTQNRKTRKLRLASQFISFFIVFMILPGLYCANQGPQQRYILPPLRKIFPEPHGVFLAIPVRRRVREDRNYRERWRYRISVTIRPRQDFFPSSPADRLGKTLNGDLQRRFVRRRRLLQPF